MLTTRLKILMIIVAILFGIIGVRIFQIGFLQHKIWVKLATAEPNFPYSPIPANRGRIFARSSKRGKLVELVGNEPCFELAVYYPMFSPDRWWLRREILTVNRELKATLGKDAKITIEQVMYIIQQRRRQFWEKISRVCNIPEDELTDIIKKTTELVSKRTSRTRKLLGENADYPLLEERMYYPILTDIDEERALELRLQLEKMEYITVRPSTKRVYRYPNILAHIIGKAIQIPGSLSKSFTITDEEYLPGEFRGVNGLEQAYDKVLKGKRGWIELSSERRILLQPVDGKDLILTVDIDLQEFVERALAEQVRSLPYATGGAVIVMDIKDNSILAIASYPSYNLETFEEEYKNLANDHINLPLFNRALMGVYPPGSIVKPLVAAYALSEGKITPNTIFTCRGYLSEKLKSFRCWLPYPGHGDMSMVSAIYNSCDIYFYHLGELLGADELIELYRKVGFGKRLEFPLPNSSGLVPTQEWFLKRWGRGISIGDARNLAIGQGDLLITPLQAIVMLKTLLTGKYNPPRLLVNEEIPQTENINLSKKAIELAQEGMELTVNLEGATAYNYVHSEKIKLAGKTGSAQALPRVIWKVSYFDKEKQKKTIQYTQNLKKFIEQNNLRDGQYSAEKVVFPQLSEGDRIDPYGRKRSLSHGWFLGYAPADHPRILACVFIEYGISGGQSAGPLFKEIMLKCKGLGYIK